ncbi:hypothetical protein [Photobacterium galatheae]|uniref:Class II aldolase/adducin N-terminal domain-containing protein n=3 Tax=Photobacterium TaxID=657 RepID=A0A066RN70_9GAMM|nr:hypothetical protein [Photobacterium galatheae]KDM90561.1 hypothetical protein EA58_16715 [Photobacterium galatheae]MCM0148085.1 hypothetical protein [Photobacterium galatheae]
MHDFSKPISGSTVTVCLVDEFRDEFLLSGAKNVADKYDITLLILDSVNDIDNVSINTEIVHFIFRLKSSFSQDIISSILFTLPTAYKSISVAFSYEDESHAACYQDLIEKEKVIREASLDCFNIMRPDTYYQGHFTVSPLKLVDNIICDTIRVKYTPVCISSESVADTLPDEVKKFFYRAAELYDSYNMFHRSYTDGYFSIKFEGVVYITATKTRKDKNLSLDRVSVIHSYCQRDNLLHYSGAFVPSSDSVEAMIVYQNSNAVELIHTHDSRRFTRNPNATMFPRIEPIEYGTVELGYKIVESISDNESNLIIMEEHGEVFIGFNHSDCTSAQAIVEAISVLELPLVV